MQPQPHLEPLYQCVPVAGTHYRADDCLDFMEAIDDGAAGGVMLQPEPDNDFDPNAIKVVGWWLAPAREERHLGYVPAVLSDLIHYKRLVGLQAELEHYDLLDGTNQIVLEIRILG